jgi:GT2 family glycosyltransferase
MPALSVVVPTFNRWRRLQSVLAALADQTLPRRELEIIVVSDGSTDGTDEHLGAGRAPVALTLLSQPNRGPAAARNAGVRAATGDLVLFIDDDVVARPECAEKHLRRQEATTSATVVIGPLLTPADWAMEPWVAWEQETLYQQYGAMARHEWEPTARQFYTGNASLPRGEILASGGFDESFRRAEDVELAYRLSQRGLSFAFERQARALHYAHRSYESWLSNATAYGRNDALMWEQGQDWLLSALLGEYRERNGLTRLYTSIGLRFPRVGAGGEKLAPIVAAQLSTAGLERAALRALSAVYNSAYYRGLLEQLESAGGQHQGSARGARIERALERRKDGCSSHE